ncbi:uncharacterized protein LOC114174516 [Vigna unguiculata]|uniref:uncharacterized protein LOC114174516 n=1 Tax=Vigna unguiculata TaxID=3917 RepID=UPI00101702D5|nr:uncharacterized protein LOC114174516 [Vigna unguiculata]
MWHAHVMANRRRRNVAGADDITQKLSFVTFLLVADAEYWWQGMQQLMQTRVEEAYTDKFEYSARFYSSTVMEEWRCQKYEGEMKHDLQRFLIPLRIREFPVLVKQAKAVEQLEMGPNRVARSQKTLVGTRQQKKPYSKPQSSARKLQCYNSGDNMSRGTAQNPLAVLEEDLELASVMRASPPARRPIFNNTTYFPLTGQPDPTRLKWVKIGWGWPVLTPLLTTIEVTQSSNLVQTICLLFNHEVVVLYDSGATHSFVSNECVRRLGLVIRELGCELIVVTLASGEVSTTSVCVGCLMEVVGRRFKVNRIFLPMEGLDVILGMD